MKHMETMVLLLLLLYLTFSSYYWRSEGDPKKGPTKFGALQPRPEFDKTLQSHWKRQAAKELMDAIIEGKRK
jgi:hypothetical protein